LVVELSPLTVWTPVLGVRVRLAAVCTVALLCACGRSDVIANECVTRGASYLVSYSAVSGNCAPIASEVINVESDGTIAGATPRPCAAVEQDGCTIRKTDCAWSSGGYDYRFTSTLTFAADGSTGSGLLSVHESGGAWSCFSTYQLSWIRQ
jgi:hypothetical protein